MKPPPGIVKPRSGDYSASSLKKLHREILASYGGNSRAVPLKVKADLFEWAIAKYHLTEYNQVHARITLFEEQGKRPQFHYGEDTSTWNGALLAALSYKYAVTKDRQTLILIERLLKGMHFYFEITGKPGLPARCVLKRDTPLAGAVNQYDSSQGEKFFYRSDAAKGTINQINCGYIAVLMHVFDDLSPAIRKMVKEDYSLMAVHLVENEYRLVDAAGNKTSYGNMTPLVGSNGVPFNAQVVYLVLATSTYFPPDNPQHYKRIRKEYKRLKTKHHVYYENPLTHWICPQKVANSPFIKGMNDRNHVVNAAFYGMVLELQSARKQKRKPDSKLLYQLGRSIYWAMETMQTHHNALCNFMWAGLLCDPKNFQTIVPFEQEKAKRQAHYIIFTGMEQLRRFPVDRFYIPGKKVETREPQWVDARKKHDSYLWKSGPYDKWVANGEVSNKHICSIDFLYAYWLMRYYRLDEIEKRLRLSAKSRK